MQLKAEITTVQAMLSNVSSLSSLIKSQGSTPFPVMGPMVMVPTLSTVADAIKSQNDNMEKLLKTLTKLIDKL